VGSGVAVSVPQPARYATHRLIVAQQARRPAEKRAKDLTQARELIAALEQSQPWALRDAIDDARRRGVIWRKAVDRSLDELGIGTHFSDK
jgi:hypothetical protein